jgi:hypothetical protein
MNHGTKIIAPGNASTASPHAGHGCSMRVLCFRHLQLNQTVAEVKLIAGAVVHNS